MRLLKNPLLPFVTLLCLLLFPPFLFADSENDLTNVPLESLMKLQVTSVSKKTQSLTNAAAAVFVITQEDIKRSGVTTIADALRMVPGVQVAKIDSNKWAISSRGFNGRFSNKLLVLMDGRSLYTPFFIGVYWEVQDTLLDDIERIEVIRGPGAALWGANAVNGVVNIITKSADESTGTLITAGGGTYENAFISGRQGIKLTSNSDIRLYVKHTARSNYEYKAGNESHDSWQNSQGGFRYDIHPNSKDSLTLQGDYYLGELKETYHLYNLNPPEYEAIVNSSTPVSGGNLIARWQRNNSESNKLSLQLYYDHTEREMLISPQIFNTVDLDFQHRFSPINSHDIIWGVGYRFNQYTVENTPTLSFKDSSVENYLFSAFLHNEISLVSDKLFLILGSRFEKSSVSEFNIQPNTRLLWTANSNISFWGSISRAVRSKTKGETDISYNYLTIPPNKYPNSSGTSPLRLEIVGNNNFKSENVLAYELGSRSELAHNLFADVAFYYNRYSDLRVITPSVPYSQPNANVQPYYLSNDMHGNAIGSELVLEWTPFPWWHLQSAYSYEKLRMYLDGNSKDTINMGNAAGDTPKQQISLRSGFDIGRGIKLDLWLRGVGRIASIDGVSIPGYITTDFQISWKLLKYLEFSIIGQNLLQQSHPEFIPEYINTLPSEVVRSGYGKITCKF